MNGNLNITEIEAKSILRKMNKIDSWFLCVSGMNIYRGCEHACVYCDGRTEKYQVAGEFGEEITVKRNAAELLQEELQKYSNKSGLIMIGGGVGDSYQPAEKDYKLTRQILEIIKAHKLPIHILTKSTLVLRDIDIIKELNAATKVIVSMSFSSVDDELSELLEPGVAPPSARLAALQEFKNAGISCGMYLMPTIPYITDTPQKIEECFQKASQLDLDFIVYTGLTLKEGRQKQFFYKFLERHYPELIDQYDDLYQEGNKWGSPNQDYSESFGHFLLTLSQKYKMPLRLPIDLVSPYLTPKDQVIATLDQIDYLRKIRGQKSSFGYTAYNISKLKEDMYQLRYCLESIKGVGPVTERIILEILNKGNSSYYDKLLRSWSN
ncbi:MAG: radical SAM protein [Candidatus Marinimicrobia bacterium]|nr:radical SAM protein [Candidatus Neomarinimicrobiota bacterium]